MIRRHKGHRERLRKKQLRGSLEPHEHVELLLFQSLPQVNTNDVAHTLLDTFGGINGMLTASEDKLMKVQGVGPASAVYIRNVADIARLYALEECDKSLLFTDDSELRRYISALFVGRCHECMYMLCFNSKGRLLATELLGEGSKGRTVISTKRVAELATNEGVKYVIFAHNHPDGWAEVSDSDKLSAKKLDAVLKPLGVKVLKHVLVAKGRCYYYNGA